jgi:hypothetical protein
MFASHDDAATKAQAAADWFADFTGNDGVSVTNSPRLPLRRNRAPGPQCEERALPRLGGHFVGGALRAGVESSVRGGFASSEAYSPLPVH